MPKNILKHHPLKTFMVVAAAAGVSWILLSVSVQWVFDHALPQYIEANIPARGQFGDMFGAVNALFSALAFAGVVTAIWHQRDELLAQIQSDREMEQQRQTISLLERWHSDEMHQSRIRADRFCEAKENSSNIDWSGMYHGIDGHRETCKDFFRIVHFFELWGRLVEGGLANEELAKQFLGHHAKEWHLRLIAKLTPEIGTVKWVAEKMRTGLYYDKSEVGASPQRPDNGQNWASS